MSLYICVSYFENKSRVFTANLIVKIISKQNLLRILLESLICIIYSKGEKSIYSSLLKLRCNQETVCLLACENLEHKGEESQCVFKEIMKNLK